MGPMPARIAESAARLALGGLYLLFGLNGFLQFLPTPAVAPPAQRFLESLYATGYMLPLWKSVEVVSGTLLLAGRWKAAALILASPVTVNIFFFHLFLDPSNPIGAMMLGAHGFLMWRERERYRPLLRP